MYKSYDQNGVASNVQLGLNGIKLDGSTKTELKVTDENGVLANIRAKAPVSGNDVVTLDYLKMKADIRVMGAIANLDTLPTSGQLTNVYYDQAGDQLVYGGKNDAGDANVWDVLDIDKDFMMLAVVEIQKADTSVLFIADRLYQYDTATSDWKDHGQAPETDMSGVVKSKKITFDYSSVPETGNMQAALFASISGKTVKEVRFNVRIAFDLDFVLKLNFKDSWYDVSDFYNPMEIGLYMLTDSLDNFENLGISISVDGTGIACTTGEMDIVIFYID